MSSSAVYCPDRQERLTIVSAMQFLMQRCGIDDLPIGVQNLDFFVAEDEAGDLFCMVCDVNNEGVIPVLEKLRSRNPEMKLVLLSGGSNSQLTLSCIRPSILPTSMLWRPVRQEQTRQVLNEIYAMYAKEGREPSQESFSLEQRGSVQRIPLDQIYFFEARDKRVYLHMARKEIPFAGTLERLTEQLPDGFVRTHKSFIVNKRHIMEIQFGQNCLTLEGGDCIPVSRSYRAALKESFE